MSHDLLILVILCFILSEIINESVTYDRKYGMFAMSGCKKFEKKVAVEVNYGH